MPSSPQPDTDINDGGAVQLTSTIYNATTLRVRDTGQVGWWRWFGTGTKTSLTQMEGAEVARYQIYDAATMGYDGGLINDKIEFYGDGNVLLITTSGNSDWTLDGSAITGYFPTDLGPELTRHKEHVFQGTMETVPIVRTLTVIYHGDDAPAISVWTI